MSVDLLRCRQDYNIYIYIYVYYVLYIRLYVRYQKSSISQHALNLSTQSKAGPTDCQAASRSSQHPGRLQDLVGFDSQLWVRDCLYSCDVENGATRLSSSEAVLALWVRAQHNSFLKWS